MALRLLPLAVLLSALLPGCATTNPAVAPVAQGSGDPDSEVPPDWLEGLPPDDATVTPEQTKALVEQVFDLIDRKIFDPAFKKEQRERSREQLLAPAPQAQTRRTLAVAIDEALKGTGMSHLRFLRPEQLRKLEAMLAAPSGERDSATVAAERNGEIGILRVGSFLVPSIRRELVEQALARLQGSQCLLLDLRGNGGGSVSSTLYLLEHVLGPDQPVSFARFRKGLGKSQPFVQRGGLPDPQNQGSAADIALERTHGYVEWRTAAEARRLDVPVYALIDQECGSSCDAVAAALRDHKAARLLGSKTAGDLLASVAFRAPWKGHLVLVPEGMVYSASGAVIEGHGVAPDVELPACAEGRPSDCLEAALTVVRADLARR